MQSFDMGGRGSAAYDLRLFQSNTAKKKKKNTVAVAQKKSKDLARQRAREKVAVVFRGLALASVLILVIVAMLCSRVELTELNTEISIAENKLSGVKTENARMQAEVESKLSARNVEEFASQKLGMTPLDKSQITYVRLNEGDEVSVAQVEPQNGILEKVQTALGGVKAYIED